MLSNIGPGMLILIIIVALLLFGPSKLPELGRAFGRTLKEFKNGAKEIMEDDPPRKEVNSSAVDTPRPDSAANEAQKSNSNDNRRLPE